MPARSAGRQVRVAKIVVLVAGAAFFRSNSESSWTAPYIHRVRMPIIALPRIISFRMTIHTARVPQHWNKGGEECPIVAGGRWRGRGLGCN